MLLYLAINCFILCCQLPFFWMHLYGDEYKKKNRNLLIYVLCVIIIHMIIPLLIRKFVSGRFFGIRPFSEL
jgi:hypothetical protein